MINLLSSSRRGTFFIACVASILIVVFYHFSIGRVYFTTNPFSDRNHGETQPGYKAILPGDPRQDYPIVSPSIFFMETSTDRADISTREVCAMESACRHHPTTPVTLLYRNQAMLNGTNLALLRRMTNFRLHWMEVLTDMFVDTPLEGSPVIDEVNRSEHKREHLSDALRFAVLWHYGGIYLDTDVVVMQPLTLLGNSLSRGYDGYVTTAVLIFERHHPFLEACLQDYADKYDPDTYEANGPILMARVHKQFCETKNRDSLRCAGVTMHKPGTFSPIKWQSWKVLFEPVSVSGVNISIAYSVHMFGKLTRGQQVKPGNGTLIELIAQENCPVGYKWMLVKDVI